MPYNRIISLVPSLTELVLDLGIGNRLVGRTRFCIHPEKLVKDIPIIGGTKNPNLEKILELEPDYIIANHEENRKEDVQALQAHTEVNITEIDTINDALNAICDLGADLELASNAQKLVDEIKILLSQSSKYPPLKTAYFIWKAPWMVAACGTYIDSVMKHYNLENVFSDQQRYPQISLDELHDQNPELVLLSSEPFPFKQKHIEEIRKVCPDSKIELVNGEWFSWYGSGMLEAFERLNIWRAKIDTGI
ncbi:MAG: helical backbone metal receptor [Balneola sp.]|jgi:iron complex transport system substrate-binding protein